MKRRSGVALAAVTTVLTLGVVVGVPDPFNLESLAEANLALLSRTLGHTEQILRVTIADEINCGLPSCGYRRRGRSVYGDIETILTI